MEVLIYSGGIEHLSLKCDFIDDAFIKKLEKIYTSALEAEGSIPQAAKDVEVSLTFMNEDEIAKINKDYRDVPSSTDVLSFPMWESENGCFTPPDDWEVLPLGDIMVCLDFVSRNADENKKTLEEETVLVISHGLLHLLGRDHDTKEREESMWREQDSLVKEYFNLQ